MTCWRGKKLKKENHFFSLLDIISAHQRTIEYIVASHLPWGSVVTVAGGRRNGGLQARGPKHPRSSGLHSQITRICQRIPFPDKPDHKASILLINCTGGPRQYIVNVALTSARNFSLQYATLGWTYARPKDLRPQQLFDLGLIVGLQKDGTSNKCKPSVIFSFPEKVRITRTS